MDLAISDGKGGHFRWRGEQEWGKYYALDSKYTIYQSATGQQDPLLVEITIF